MGWLNPAGTDGTVRGHLVGKYTMAMFGFGKWECCCRMEQKYRMGQKIKHKNQTGITHIIYAVWFSLTGSFIERLCVTVMTHVTKVEWKKKSSLNIIIVMKYLWNQIPSDNYWMSVLGTQMSRNNPGVGYKLRMVVRWSPGIYNLSICLCIEITLAVIRASF